MSEEIIYTDIARDGMLSGPNIPALEEVARQTGLSVIASGGVSSLQDLIELKKLEGIGVRGAIVGKALYDGRLDLAEALRQVEGVPLLLAKRIIPCLDVKDGRVVKGTNFLNLRDAGDPVELAAFYDREGADELVFLDITASHERRKTVVEMVAKVAKEVFIPFTVGGGITSIDDIREILLAGADKVSINTAAVNNPDLRRRAPGSLAANVSFWLRMSNGGSPMILPKGGRSTSMAGGPIPVWMRWSGSAKQRSWALGKSY